MLNCAEELAAQGEYFADVISKHATQQGGLAEGATFQVGWSVWKLVPTRGTLELHEPDYSGNPFLNFRSNISASLKVLLAQNEIVQKTHANPCTARFDDKIVLRKGCLTQDRLYMERSTPADGDSGWYISRAGEHSNPEVNELESIYSFQLLSLRPSLLSCLLLPPGWLVVWNGDKIEAVVNAQDETILSEVQ
jgi:hypothetical protein